MALDICLLLVCAGLGWLIFRQAGDLSILRRELESLKSLRETDRSSHWSLFRDVNRIMAALELLGLKAEGPIDARWVRAAETKQKR